MVKKTRNNNSNKKQKNAANKSDKTKETEQSEVNVQMASKNETIEVDSSVNNSEKKSFCLSLDKKLQLQIKKQKKKEKKREFEAGKSKKDTAPEEAISENVEIVSNEENSIVNQVTENMEVGEVKAETISESESFSDKDRSLQPDKTEILNDATELSSESSFQEFINGKESVQVNESVKNFSPSTKDASVRKEISSGIQESKGIRAGSPPNIVHNYCGGVSAEPSLLVIEEAKTDDENDERNENEDKEKTCVSRRLDIIVEESSDFSDVSGNSGKKNKVVKSFDMRNDEILMASGTDAVDYYRGTDETSESASDGNGMNEIDLSVRNREKMQPMVANVLKMLDDVVNVDFTETETENENELNKTTSDAFSNNKSEDEIAKTEDTRTSEIVNYNDSSGWSIKSISSYSVKVAEDESESWRTSLGTDTCDGAEADVESELDSQRVCVLNDFDEMFDPKIIFPGIENDSIHISITDYKNSIEGNGKRTAAESDDSLRFSWDSSSRFPTYETFCENLIREKTLKDYEDKCVEITGSDLGKSDLATSENEISTDCFVYKNNADASANVSVKCRVKEMGNDLDRVLISKLRVIQQNQSRPRDESFSTFLKDAIRNREKDSAKPNLSPKDAAKAKRNFFSNLSYYDNVSNSETGFPIASTPPKKSKTPEALSNLAEKRILTLPYGKLVLKKLGLNSCCSKDSESTKDVEEEMYIKNNLLQNDKSPGSPVPSEMSVRSIPIRMSSTSSTTEDHDYMDSHSSSRPNSYIEFACSDSVFGDAEKWYGTRTLDPALLLGLSPSQKRIYEKNSYRFMPEEAEAANLIDLHEKFLKRRSYHETNSQNQSDGLSSNKRSHVKITDIIEKNDAYGKTENLFETKTSNGIMKGKSVVAGDHVRLVSGFDSLPIGSKTRSDENQNSENRNNLSRTKCYKEDCEKEKKIFERSKKTNKESVGKSCLLAILQNAISDKFVPELNEKCSIKSSSESHEVSSVQNQGTMSDFWQNDIIGYASGKFANENLYAEGRKNFEKIWNKEHNITKGGRLEKSGNIHRPRTICVGSDAEVKEPVPEKKLVVPKKTFYNLFSKLRNHENDENIIVTEKLPAVSEVIKTFEKPKWTPVPENYDKGRKMRILINNETYNVSKNMDIAHLQNGNKGRIQREKRKSMPPSILSEKEIFKQKMYEEYMSKLAERIERRQKRVIIVSQSNEVDCAEENSNFSIENEFIKKVKEREEKLNGVQATVSEELETKDPESADYWKGDTLDVDICSERLKDGGTESSNSKRSSVQLVLDSSSDIDNLPNHLKELLQLEEEFSDLVCGVWSPVQKFSGDKTETREENVERKKLEDEPIPPVWTPKSAQASPVLERKEFRPVNFESPVLLRKKYVQDRESSIPPPWQHPEGDKPPELSKSLSSPGLSLPKAPNPTVTLLQKAREGHLPKGADYLKTEMNDYSSADGPVIESLEIVSSAKKREEPKKIEVTPRKVVGIGPITKEGIPLVLRSEVADENREKWYKRMYDSLHKAGKDDDYVTVKYRTSPSRKVGISNYGQGSSSGYQSEPESLNYDLSSNIYVALDRRRAEEKSKDNEAPAVEARPRVSPPRRDYGLNNPGRIENYEPGHSSISELEANKWWDEVLEIFDREEEKSRPVRKPQYSKSFTNYATGFISDPQYVYKRTEEELRSPSSEEQKEAYRIIQKGGEIPLKGLRKPAPERPKDFDTEIEYFPLSPTLTKIRVHKHTTPLSEFPFNIHPFLYQETTLNYPALPVFGVCSSYSQVQIFPSLSQSQFYNPGSNPITQNSQLGREQKFSVQLQNISGPDDYIQIIPKPRNNSKKHLPIYANLPFSSNYFSNISHERGKNLVSETISETLEEPDIVEQKEVPDSSYGNTRRVAFATFSDLKRVAPSVLTTSKIPFTSTESKEKKRKHILKSTVLKRSSPASKTILKKSSEENKKARSSSEDKENFAKKKSVSLKSKPLKSEREPSKAIKSISLAEEDQDLEKFKRIRKKSKQASESIEEEKPVSNTSKRLSENLNKKKEEKKKLLQSNMKKKEIMSKTDNIKYKSGSFKRETYKSGSDNLNPGMRFDYCEEVEENITMSPVYESIDSSKDTKPKGVSDITEAFRSRSFSPDVKRKISKPPDMNKPIPPKRKQSKFSPTLKMWSRMKVMYPGHRSRFDDLGSNVKFLQEKIRRKLKDDKSEELEFGDDMKTFRTIGKDNDGEMSLRTSRHVSLIRPRSTFPDIGHRRSTSDSRIKFSSMEALKADPTVNKSKKFDVSVRNSSTYVVKKSTGQNLKPKVKSVSSSKSTETAKKISDARKSTSPCPSVGSYKSGVSVKSYLSEKGSNSSQERTRSPQMRIPSPVSVASRLSSTSRSASPGSVSARSRMQKYSAELQASIKKSGSLRGIPKPPLSPKSLVKGVKSEIATKVPVLKSPSEKKILTNVTYTASRKTESVEKERKSGQKEIQKSKKSEFENSYSSVARKIEKPLVKTYDLHHNEITSGRDLVRTDSFFQNLFLRGSRDRLSRMDLERKSCVLERARMYQNKINWPETYKSEPSLSLVSLYLNQKRPVSYSKFKFLDRELNSYRPRSPLGNLHSENFEKRLRHFDSMSQFGESFSRDLSPIGKERSSSEPPFNRCVYSSRVSQSESSSMKSSPTSSRSPSSKRITYKTYTKHWEGSGPRKLTARARSAGDVDDIKFKSGFQSDMGGSVSSLNLSNLSDHTEYQAYILELMHSSRKCERFRELHKFYSNLERMEKLEKTASTGDLRPRLKNEEIIDFERWKKIRIKERAEAELKTLVDNLVKTQKEKDLLFRASHVDAVRWKGDRGLRIKEKSVEDLKDQFNRYSEETDSAIYKKDVDTDRDKYRFSRKSGFIAASTSSVNPFWSRSARVDGFDGVERNQRIGKEYGHSLKAWSTLSNEEINSLKDQLSEIYSQENRKSETFYGPEDTMDKYDILVSKNSLVKSPGENSLQVRCSSAMSKSQLFTPTVKRKEEIRKQWKKADSISAFPLLKTDSDKDENVSRLFWKEEVSKLNRSHSEGRCSEEKRLVMSRLKSSSSTSLSESDKKRLSMTLSREVIEKMARGKSPVLPRETLGAIAVDSSKLKDSGSGKTESRTEDVREFNKLVKVTVASEFESGSGSSGTSIRTVVQKNPGEVLKTVQYFEDLRQTSGSYSDGKEIETDLEASLMYNKGQGIDEAKESVKLKEKTKLPCNSMENLNDYFGRQKQFDIRPSTKFVSKDTTKVTSDGKDVFDERKWISARYHSASPMRSTCSGSSNESLFSGRPRSVSPDPTKYYRAYLKMVKCGAVRKLCNKFESWEDLVSLSSDRDFWLPPAPRRFASDPELTRDLLRRFGTNPTKVTIRGQEVGDVRWLRTKFEKDSCPTRSRSRFRRARSPLRRSPITASDRYMPRINVISKKAELQLQGLSSENRKPKESISPTRFQVMEASAEGYSSLIDYTKDHGGYYYTGEVDKLRRKFERLQEIERLSVLGQMYTSTPDVNELRDIAPYLECSWIAHRYPGGLRHLSPEPEARKRDTSKKFDAKPRPHSSSPVRPKQPLSILKQPSPSDIFADQKYDPSIHRPKYRYQPEREVDRKYKRGDPDWWRHWNKPTVTFKDSPRKYVESEVTIHYKSPVRAETKEMLSEDELARRQAESMKRIYKEERRRKYLQELQDINSRRHTDNFTPSQKSPIALNRYDDFPLDTNLYYTKGKDYTIDPVLVARGLYDFIGRRPRELAFRRGDIIFIIRRLDKNWCEGELNGAVGLFPLSYVEVIPYNEINMKSGRARAKYDFVAQTPLELTARKGDMITLLCKVDENWFEGRIGERTGIIPASYCHVMAMPQASRMSGRSERVSKPVAAPAAHSLVHDGSALSSKHYYTPYMGSPNSPGRSTVSSTSAQYHDGNMSADMLIDEALLHLDEEFDLKPSSSKSSSQPLNVRVNPRPEPALYQVLYNHVPHNDDELELIQGERVMVVEKCGDGWYIGSKTSDGKLGIFPGTHVRRIA